MKELHVVCGVDGRGGEREMVVMVPKGGGQWAEVVVVVCVYAGSGGDVCVGKGAIAGHQLWA